jgi:hypothetical protein
VSVLCLASARLSVASFTAANSLVSNWRAFCSGARYGWPKNITQLWIVANVDCDHRDVVVQVFSLAVL